MSTLASLSLEETRAYRTAGAQLRRTVRQFETVHSRFDRSLRAIRHFETLQRQLSTPLASPGDHLTSNTMTALRLQNIETSRLFTHTATARVLPNQIEMQRLQHLHRLLHIINDHRTLAARWWLDDDIDPATPHSVRGLDEALPQRRRRIDQEVAAGAQARAGLRYRQRCAADAPGQLVTARRQVPRGPNTRLLTENCQQAG
ncbi:hypothetical protein ACFWPX_36375 [Nocardia sp. NPDC058518]|uniref:hypothetical protein n=1 Tax=Nocardia sp. NPDC058518 TaxID=3346534 RepID=UPI00364CB8A3